MNTAIIMDMMFNTEMIVKDMQGGKEDMTENKRFKEVYPDIIRSNYCFTDNGKGIDDKEVCELLNRLSEYEDLVDEVIDKHIRYYEEIKEQKGIDKEKVHQRLLAVQDLKHELFCKKWEAIPKPEFTPLHCRCVFVPFEGDEK